MRKDFLIEKGLDLILCMLVAMNFGIWQQSFVSASFMFTFMVAIQSFITSTQAPIFNISFGRKTWEE